MRSTPFNTRSSEWIGDMTVYLRETGEDNSLQMERLRRNLRRAREQELTPRQRQMLELHYDQRLSVTEIAKELGLHPLQSPARWDGPGSVCAGICATPYKFLL